MKRKALDLDFEREDRLEMTPMIDVTFLLLVFFLCTIRFKTLEGKLSAYLPKSEGVNPTHAEPIQKIDVQLRVTAEGERRSARDSGRPWDGQGRFQWIGREVRYRVGPREFSDLEDVRRRVEELHRLDPERPARIEAGSGSLQSEVVHVLDALREAGLTEISFVGSAD